MTREDIRLVSDRDHVRWIGVHDPKQVSPRRKCWIGRATDKEFVGFYTNAFYTGVFTLTRK